MSAATPGPWRPVRDAQGICGLMHPTREGVAVAWLSEAHGPAEGYVGSEETVEGFAEREANAALMLAAPALRDCAEAALMVLDCEWTDEMKSRWLLMTRSTDVTEKALRDMLRAALALADGGTK